MKGRPNIDALAERLFEATDSERYDLLRRTESDADLRCDIKDARALLIAIRAESNEPVPSTDDTALDLARGRISRGALLDPDGFELVLASLGVQLDARVAASASTRRALREIAGSRRRAAWMWMPALGAAAAALVVGFLFTRPPSDPWARTLDVSRARVWRMSDELILDVRSALSDGTTSTQAFPPSRGPSRRERDAVAVGAELPTLLYPRREHVAELRPAFRWTVSAADAPFEVVLVDDSRSLVWSAEGRGTELSYPDDRPDLEAGRVYHWKVNLTGGDQLRASSFAVFRTLDAAARQRVDADLRAVGAHPFLRGTVFDRHRLYGPAADAFDAASGVPGLGETAANLRDAVRTKQELGP